MIYTPALLRALISYIDNTEEKPMDLMDYSPHQFALNVLTARLRKEAERAMKEIAVRPDMSAEDLELTNRPVDSLLRSIRLLEFVSSYDRRA